MTIDAEPDWAQAAEASLLEAAVGLAPQEGWTARTVRLAAATSGLSQADAALLLPGGPSDLAALLWRRQDRRGMEGLAGLDPRNMKVRDRIQRSVEARVEAAAADGEATRRLLGFLALPGHMTLGARLLWDSADALWRWAGDEATDENHYSKRVILSGVLGPALALRLSAGREASDAYVFRRIGNVMAFETWKAGLPKTDLAAQFAGFLGKLRYGLKPRPPEPPTGSD
jgi:ubiquinone biosynthesis protein COQ9